MPRGSLERLTSDFKFYYLPAGILEFQAGCHLQGGSFLAGYGATKELVGYCGVTAYDVALIAGAGAVLATVLLVDNQVAFFIAVIVVVAVAVECNFDHGFAYRTHTGYGLSLVENLPAAYIEEAVIFECQLDAALIAYAGAKLVLADAIGDSGHT